MPLSRCLERMWPIDGAVGADRFASSTIHAGFVLSRRRSFAFFFLITTSINICRHPLCSTNPFGLVNILDHSDRVVDSPLVSSYDSYRAKILMLTDHHIEF